MNWWPWKPQEEHRESGGYDSQVLALLTAQAEGTTADTARTAAIEAVAGLVSRSFMGAKVDGAGWVQDAVTPKILAQVGRDLIRHGEVVHVIAMTGDGMVKLRPASTWHWQDGDTDPDSWVCRATIYGPSASRTLKLPQSGVVWLQWAPSEGFFVKPR